MIQIIIYTIKNSYSLSNIERGSIRKATFRQYISVYLRGEESYLNTP